MTKSQSIYTQALDDWEGKSWTDFMWSRTEGVCPGGYEAIGVTWRGTLPYNITSDGVSVEYQEDSRMAYGV